MKRAIHKRLTVMGTPSLEYMGVIRKELKGLTGGASLSWLSGGPCTTISELSSIVNSTLLYGP